MLSKICGCGQNNVHETSPVKKAGVSLTLMATAGALFTLGALLLLSHKLEATRLAPLGRYLSQHSQAARISGIVSITLGALTTLTLATYLSCPSNKKPPTPLIKDPSPSIEEHLDTGSLVDEKDYPDELFPHSRQAVYWSNELHLVQVYRDDKRSRLFFFKEKIPHVVDPYSDQTNPNILNKEKITIPLYSLPIDSIS